MRDSTLNLQAV